MPRQLRIQYPGAIYHLMSRGDHMSSRAYLCNLLSTKPQTPNQRQENLALLQ
jgi:hypothetical protein